MIASFGDELLKMWFLIVSSLSNKGFCGRKETPASLLITIEPSSGTKIPAIVFNKVDFPVPFFPIKAAFSPSWIPNVTSVNKGYPKEPGDIRGTIYKDVYGQIRLNTINGIYGEIENTDILNLKQTIEVLEKYHAYNAANLDGGSSSELVINNQIINTPVAGGRYGLRDMSTFWVVKE